MAIAQEKVTKKTIMSKVDTSEKSTNLDLTSVFKQFMCVHVNICGCLLVKTPELRATEETAGAEGQFVQSSDKTEKANDSGSMETPRV